MKNRLLRIALTAVMALMGAGAVSPAAHASGSPPDCYVVSIDNPHISTGAGGVISKVRFECTPGVGEMYWLLQMTMCTSSHAQPDASTPGCAVVASNSNAEKPPPIGVIFTRYVPGQVSGQQTGVKGTGYFNTEALWLTNTNATIRKAWSASVPLTSL